MIIIHMPIIIYVEQSTLHLCCRALINIIDFQTLLTFNNILIRRNRLNSDVYVQNHVI